LSTFFQTLVIYICYIQIVPCQFLLKVEEKKGGAFFTFLVFNQVSSQHSGSYTCVASNSAASVNYTAQLLVKGQFSEVKESIHKTDCKFQYSMSPGYKWVVLQKVFIVLCPDFDFL